MTCYIYTAVISLFEHVYLNFKLCTLRTVVFALILLVFFNTCHDFWKFLKWDLLILHWFYEFFVVPISKKLIKPMKNQHFCVLGSREPSWVVLGRLGGILASWGVLWASLGVLGAFWGF